VADPSRIGQPHTDHRVAKSTRAERAERHAHDFANPHDFPEIGRDVPHAIHPDGYPVMQLKTRIESLGRDGIWWVTTCPMGCGKDLWYKACSDCETAIMLSVKFGVEPQFDRMCQCRRESWVIFLRCDDHKRWEDPVPVNRVDPRSIPIISVPRPT
jgi:hypothetical protein